MTELTREAVHGELEQALYELSDDYDPTMPKLWQRGVMTRSPIEARCDSLLAHAPLLAAWIASLPPDA